jgi:NADH-quinone oxidoreductase subunit N
MSGLLAAGVTAALHPALAPAYGPDPIPTPHLQYAKLVPLLIVFGVATGGVLVEATLSAPVRRIVQPLLAIAGFLTALGFVAHLATNVTQDRGIVGASAVANDGPALFIEGLLLVLAVASVMLVTEKGTGVGGGSLVAQASVLPGEPGAAAQLLSAGIQTEAYPLMVFSVGGMMLFAAANTLLVSFVGLEVLSLPLYLLAGLARRRRLLSQEAALKYFLLGAFSSAFFLYGLALVYGFAGSVNLADIATATQVTGKNDLLLYLGMILLGVGLLFKVSAAPFHNWTPDVYQGAPTPITGFMAALTKVAAFGALLRIFYVSFGPVRDDWRPVIFAVAILTMVVGAVLAVTQRDVKRMLAYSSIAHAGFLLVGVASANADGISGSLFYLVTYGFTTIGSFAIVTLVRDADGEATHLSKWQGLGKRSPLVAGAFAFFLFALAGIPLTSGFMAKFAVFKASLEGGGIALVIVGVTTSAIAAFFYARVVVLMFFQEPTADSADVAVPSFWTAGAIALGLAVTVVLGIIPGPVLHLSHSAGLFVR